MRRVSGVVFAGGRSARFGSDKFLFPIDGVPMGVHAVQALIQACSDEVWLQGGGQPHEAVSGIRRKIGSREGSGPLGALLDALEVCESDVLVTLPCDVPGIAAPEIQKLIDALAPESHVSVAYSAQPNGDRDHNWLIAAWNVAALQMVRTAYDSGLRSMHEVIHALNWTSVPLASSSMRNVNEYQP